MSSHSIPASRRHSEPVWNCFVWNHVLISSGLLSKEKDAMFVLEKRRSLQSLPVSSTLLPALGSLKSSEMTHAHAAHKKKKKEPTKKAVAVTRRDGERLLPTERCTCPGREDYDQPAVSIFKPLRMPQVGNHLLIHSWHSWGPNKASILGLAKMEIVGRAISLRAGTGPHAG